MAQILDFGGVAPKLEPRSKSAPLTQAGALAGIDGNVKQFAIDPAGRRVLAIVEGQQKLFVIDCKSHNAVAALALPGTPAAVCVAGARSFVMIAGTGLAEVGLASQRIVKTWPISGVAPGTIAVIPVQGIALFPQNRTLAILDLDSGKISATQYVAHAVAADPRQQFCYVYVRQEADPSAGQFIIDGRPVMIERTNIDWIQTALFKFAIEDKHVLPAELRMNAASNGRQLVVSPDGDFVAVVGGGGWRPDDAADRKAGYGVATIAAADFQQVQGCFTIGAYPTGAAINSVTHQIAVIRGDEAKVYHLTRDDDSQSLPGANSGIAAWSPDGKYLYLAGAKGIHVWQNELTPDEEKASLTWAAKMLTLQLSPRKAAAQPVAEPIADAIKTFEIKNELAATKDAIRLAGDKPSKQQPQEWLQYQPYQSDAALSAAFREISGHKDAADAGLRIYQLKKLKADHADNPGIDFLLGMSYFFAGQQDQSIQAHLAAIHGDQARTNITLEALRCMGQIERRKDQPQAAAYCYAHVLRLDPDNPLWVREATVMFTQAKVMDAAKQLLAGAGKARSTGALSGPRSDLVLPTLPTAPAAKELTSEQLFQKCAPSVVLIRSDHGTGSGVCIAAGGLVVTNRHVVGNSATSVTVYAFRTANGKTERSKPIDAEIVFESEADDLALVKLKTAPKSLVPDFPSREPTVAGAKVFAVGNPGLGDVVLNQSITEGVVSAAERAISGHAYIQHTAAVNPGNSGGPLLDTSGRLAGLVTLKADLEGVSFAIPAAPDSHLQVRPTTKVECGGENSETSGAAMLPWRQDYRPMAACILRWWTALSSTRRTTWPIA